MPSLLAHMKRFAAPSQTVVLVHGRRDTSWVRASLHGTQGQVGFRPVAEVDDTYVEAGPDELAAEVEHHSFLAIEAGGVVDDLRQNPAAAGMFARPASLPRAA